MKSAALGLVLALAIAAVDFNRFDLVTRDGPLYPVDVNAKYGFIDQRGQVVVKPRFTRANAFHEEWSAVFEDNAAGYLNAKGEPQIPLIYESAGDYSEGYSAVRKVGSGDTSIRRAGS